MKKKQFKMTRRQVLKAGLIGGAGLMFPWRFLPRAHAVTLVPGLSDPAIQPKFAEIVPNALDPGFIYDTSKGKIKVAVGQTVQETGLVDTDGNRCRPPSGVTVMIKCIPGRGAPSRCQATNPLKSSGRIASVRCPCQ